MIIREFFSGDFILQLTIILLIASLSIRINYLEHNYRAIKEWLKVLNIIDLDAVTEAVREFEEEDN